MKDTTATSMDTPASTEPRALWIGRVLTALVTVFMLADGGVAVFAPHLLQGDMAVTGFGGSTILPIGALAIACAVLYAIPATATLGAILTTGFFGGAICTHYRVGEVGTPPQLICLLVGVTAWLGLYLRDARVRAILPLRG